MLYELLLCAGLTAWGCGFATVTPYPTRDACLADLREMRIEMTQKELDLIAYCRPKEKK